MATLPSDARIAAVWRPLTASSAFLLIIVWFAFGQARTFGFVNYDDPAYTNAVVSAGLTANGVTWALTYARIGHWHPLTWISHMADFSLFGWHAGLHHVTSILLHTATTVLLLFVLFRATGKVWRSAFVAGCFSVHPLRVESVVWISERKDVLSGLFFVLTIAAYLRYVRRPSKLSMAVVTLAFALGLLAKNMVLTTPFVLMVLDYWPLRRITRENAGQLVLEKLPLLLLSACSIVITLLSPEKLSGFEALPIGVRLGNAIDSIIVYLRQTIWPVGLAVSYPNPVNRLPYGQVAVAGALVCAVSAIAWATRRRHPYLLAGWLWFVIMLTPVLGIVQISYYAHADRYTYLPQIGLLIAVTWMISEAVSKSTFAGTTGLVAGLTICASLAAASRHQTRYWSSSEILWRHALAVTEPNAVAEHGLGVALANEGRRPEAIQHLRRATSIKPTYVFAWYDLGEQLRAQGETDEAFRCLRRALELEPRYAEAEVAIGKILLRNDAVEDAIPHLQRAVELKPDLADAQHGLGSALLRTGNAEAALQNMRKAVELAPRDVATRADLANALLQTGDVPGALNVIESAVSEDPGNPTLLVAAGNVYASAGKREQAEAEYRKAISTAPQLASAYVGLGDLLAANDRIEEGVRSYEAAISLNPSDAVLRTNLGAALVRIGRKTDAMVQYRRALELNPHLAEAHVNLGSLLALDHRCHEAVEHLETGVDLTGKRDLSALDKLAAVHALCGDFEQAALIAREIADAAAARGDVRLAQAARDDAVSYQAEQRRTSHR